ncbi:MAG: Do family serine endopeptidase [Planctomycetaceae bacterium]|nr:Do family serine endopeptidase [Planctomycetaceae bacterium]
MKITSTFRNRAAIAAAVSSALLAGAALHWHSMTSAVAQTQPGSSLAKAYELSDAFREVSRRTLPAVVSIRTTGKVVKQKVARSPFGNGSPFGNDPFFREFFNDPRFRGYQEDDRDMEREFRMPGGQGSGFLIDPDGLVMTNHHVVQDSEEVIVQLADGREFTATDIRSDARSDVAVVKIDVREKLPFIPLGNDEEMEIGDWVLAFGSPFGLHRSVTQGIISAKGRGLSSSRMPQEFLQTDAAINPGNSGGPLVNLRGEVIGINTAISTRSGGYDGVSLAVPVNLAKWVAGQLRKDGKVHRAYVGITMQEIDAQLAEAFSLKIPRGVVVTGVMKGSPADAAGFQEGDVILEVDGRKITTDRNMLSVVEQLEIGRTYVIKVLREGQDVDLRITVQERPDKFNDAADEDTGNLSQPGNKGTDEEIRELGIAVQDLTGDLAEQLGMPAGSGVVITSVKRASSAEDAGLESAMVITRAGNQNVSNVSDLATAVKAARDSGKLLLLVKFSAGNSTVAKFVTVELNKTE